MTAQDNMKLPKNQKCWLCKKMIKGVFCFNGHYWHDRCKEKDTKKLIKRYLI
ncbi:MAG: hypothetical protein AABY22_24290 [Nanoarchaeota archaeon]